MRQLLLGLVARTRRGPLRARRWRVVGASLAVLVAGCASPSLVPQDQADAITRRDRALAPHAEAIQAAIRQSGATGALAFLDATAGRLVVLPGDTPADAWARHAAAPERAAGAVAVPAVVAFVYRADVPAAPAPVSARVLQQHQAFRASLAALDVEVREAQRRTEARLAETRRELAESVAAAQQETDRSLAAATADTQRALRALADDLAAARTFMLQTAQLGWLTHELNVENAGGIRKVEATSQALLATSARLAATMQQLSDGLARQLKELTDRLEAIRSKMGELK